VGKVEITPSEVCLRFSQAVITRVVFLFSISHKRGLEGGAGGWGGGEEHFTHGAFFVFQLVPGSEDAHWGLGSGGEWIVKRKTLLLQMGNFCFAVMRTHDDANKLMLLSVVSCVIQPFLHCLLALSQWLVWRGDLCPQLLSTIEQTRMNKGCSSRGKTVHNEPLFAQIRYFCCF